MRRFVVVGRTARASPDFSLVDLAGTSGRLDVLVRAQRAALLVSHGVRRDVVVDLVLSGGPRAPRIVRVDGSLARWVRPEERRLALAVQRALEALDRAPPDSPRDALGFLPLRNGYFVREGGLAEVLATIPAASTRIVLDEAGEDLAALAGPGSALDAPDLTFIVGDHEGLDGASVALLEGARRLSLGPVSLLAEDAITVTHHTLDRRA